MSYCVTDAGEQEMRKELKALEQLTEDVDQAASLARDCGTLCPEAKTLLDIAWYFTEKAIREVTGRCSAGCSTIKSCNCCRHFAEMRTKAERIGRTL